MKNVGGLNVSRETIDRLKEFEKLVLKWTKHINLIAPATTPDIWDRHIVDSIQLYQYSPKPFKSWADLGSGGGFPGIVLAIVARQMVPDAQFTLVESDTRKATFLRTSIRELDLNANVVADRLENAEPIGADVISARALSPLTGLFSMITRHIGPNGIAIIPKGRAYEAEIAKAKENWRFDLQCQPSITDPEARILIVKDIERERP